MSVMYQGKGGLKFARRSLSSINLTLNLTTYNSPSSPTMPSQPTPNHLIIVCGHAIWLGGPSNGWDESEWLIEAYKKGEMPTFIAHIKAGIEELAKDDRAVLMFSGGPTRPETHLSEAQSYYNLALANSFFGLSSSSSSSSSLSLKDRIYLEERALDSYYNILFSLIHYWRVTSSGSQHGGTGAGTWPERITIVSHAFKRNRLVDGHCAAIFGLDPSSPELKEKVRFVGINPPGIDGGGRFTIEGDGDEKKKEAMQGVQLAMGQWAEDPHGVGEELAGKRRARNCWGVDQRLFFSEEERRRSGVETRVLEDGSEVLVDVGGGKPRPWAR